MAAQTIADPDGAASTEVDYDGEINLWLGLRIHMDTFLICHLDTDPDPVYKCFIKVFRNCLRFFVKIKWPGVVSSCTFSVRNCSVSY
jgi:hypothetical protein